MALSPENALPSSPTTDSTMCRFAETRMVSPNTAVSMAMTNTRKNARHLRRGMPEIVRTANRQGQARHRA